MILYSATTGWFYSSDHPVIPADAVSVSAAQHQQLLNAQSAGKIITSDSNGYPVAVEPPLTATVPASISPRQARLVLLAAGLLATVEATIAAMPSPEGDAARIEWEYATEIRRNSALLEALGPQLSLTSEQIDQMFIQAIVL